MIPSNIPEELRSAKRWLLWQLIQTERDKKPRKIPLSARRSGCGATSKYAHAWETFDAAFGVAQRLKGAGIGYVFVKEDGLVGIDLDKCRNRDTGKIEPWAQEIVDQFKGFTEISPSGTGIHIIVKGSITKAVRGTLPGGGAVEIYPDSRYFTVTGDILPGRNELHEEQAGIEWLMNRMEDGKSLERLFNDRNGDVARKLWAGDLDPCGGDHSKADFRLLSLLLDATKGDRNATERLFEKSKLAERDKWQDRDDYRQRTLKNVFSGFRSQPTANFKVAGEEGFSNYTTTTDDSIENGPDNDHSHALALIRIFDGQCRFDHASGRWLLFDEHTGWREDDTQMIKIISLKAEKEARDALSKARGADSGELKKLVNRIGRYGSAARIDAALSLASSDPSIACSSTTFDNRPHELGVLNGVVDLRTGEFRGHQSEDLITQRTGVAYIPDAIAPRWEAFLLEVMCGDQERVDYLQRLVGYTLTGETTEQAFYFLYGHGANGKSTFIETIQKVAGRYARRASDNLIYSSHHGREPQQELAALLGARLVAGQESGEGRKLNEGVIKSITGGDTITARKLYCAQFDYKPGLKLWLYGNHKPAIEGGDYGIWRRVRLIPFAAKFSEEQQDKTLSQKLSEELPGILNWAIEGAKRWYENGMNIPKSIQEVTAQYRQDSDVLGQFIEECTIENPQTWISKAELYRAYQVWAEESGIKYPMTKNNFCRRLKERGRKDQKTADGHRWLGIELRSYQTSFARAA